MSTPSHLEVLQKAIAALKANAGVTALVGTRIYNHIPQNSTQFAGTFPYMLVRWDNASQWDTKDSQGFDGEIRVDAWTENQGDKDILQIVDAVNSALHNNELTLTAGENLILRYENATYFTEPDGVAHHSVNVFRCVVTG